MCVKIKGRQGKEKTQSLDMSYGETDWKLSLQWGGSKSSGSQCILHLDGLKM